MGEQRGLVPIGIVAPLVTVDEAVAEWERYLELCKRLLDKSDYQVIQGRQFRKKSGWRKLARAFNLTDEIVEKDIIRDEGQRVISAEILVKATAPNGRVAYGWGACGIYERAHEEDKRSRRGDVTCKGPCNGRAHFSNPDHDVPATAHTRAKNRAISDLIGAGEVSAEEMGGENIIKGEARKPSGEERPAEGAPEHKAQAAPRTGKIRKEQLHRWWGALHDLATARTMSDENYDVLAKQLREDGLTRENFTKASQFIEAWEPEASQEEVEPLFSPPHPSEPGPDPLEQIPI